MNAEPFVLVPYGSDSLETLAALMLERHQRDLPDLSQYVVLFPHAGAIAHFRRALLAAATRHGHPSLLAPWCGTLESWLRQCAAGDLVPVDGSERELLLLEALASHPDLHERFGTWTLVDSLLTLFDELNAHRGEFAADADRLAAQLAAGYGVQDDYPPLRAETRLVHTLWTGWNEHLLQHRLADKGLQRLTTLAALAQQADAPAHVYIVGAIELTATEAQWIKSLLPAGRATVLLQGGAEAAPDSPDAAVARAAALLDLPVPPPTATADPYTRLVDDVYRMAPDMNTRARAFARACPQDPLPPRLAVYTAGDFEEEARAVDLAVRRWRAAGAHTIGVVTHDRRLARRVRALLERANLRLRDDAGWALSTTSAATAVVRWIECVEQDFAYRPLLDFLKSPFTTFDLDRARIEPLIGAFERHIVRARNVSAGLDRYRHALSLPLSDEELAGSLEPLTRLLDRLQHAAEPLAHVHRGGARAPAQYLDALRRSLERTGLAANLATDAAGGQLLAVLRPERRALTARGVRLRWDEFRQWLQREIERSRFHPPLPDDGIELLGLAESRCRTFDALVLAGCNRDHLPGPLATSPFFNDGVRRELGLPTRQERLAAPLHDFRRLLEAAPHILVTSRRNDNGDPVIPSPWTERLVTFHRLAYSAPLDDTALADLLASPQTELLTRDAPLPDVAAIPAPALPADRLPPALTATSHQRLLDCPYQFFAAVSLGLAPLGEVREELEKTDYGRLVHRILQAFHAGVAGLPGPWQGALTAENRAAAEALLYELGRRVFAYDRDRRLSTRGWRYRWENFVPAYLDWQQERERRWHPQAAERAFERTVTDGNYTLTLHGRLDRIDRGPDGLAVVDYKTGSVPTPQDVAAGEHSQLPFYAMLPSEPVHEAAFAALERDSVKVKTVFAAAELTDLVASFERRLHAMMRSMQAGAPMPAWGDNDVCAWCDYQGLCRKEMWRTQDS